MRLIDADVLFSVLHDRMKGAEEWITRAETDELKARAEGFLSALIEVKMSVEDEVTTIEEEPVRRGHWLYTEAWPHRVYCSVCYRTYALKHWQIWEDGSLQRAYCPSCGAKMDGGDENEAD